MSDTTTDVLGFLHDHADIAWSHWLAQHIGKPNTENFVRAFYGPLNILDQALNDMYVDRWLETAEGDQLDGIASIVGTSRTVPHSVYVSFFGFANQVATTGFNQSRLRHENEPWASSSVLGDTDLKTLISFKIFLNNGHGTAEELMNAFNYSLGVTNTRVMDIGDGKANVYINDFFAASDPRSQMLNYMVPKAGGVKLFINFWNLTATFGFSNQNMGYVGFGQGMLTMSTDSALSP